MHYSQWALGLYCWAKYVETDAVFFTARPLSHWKLISKLISKFMLISSFRKKISSVNSQLSKGVNFEILFCNLEHVLLCEISQKKFHLWSALIGHSASVYKHRTKCRLRRRCWLSKVYFQCESAYFREKNFQIFMSKCEFQN